MRGASIRSQPSLFGSNMASALGRLAQITPDPEVSSGSQWRAANLSKAKLKASSRTSALLAGFAMVALVEIDIDKDISETMLIIYGISTTLLVSVHLLALMMSTCILPHMESVCTADMGGSVSDSPHVRLKWYIELSWFFSTVLGLLLFLLEIGVICWMKLSFDSAKYVAIGLLLPVFVLFIIFTVTFYNKLMRHHIDRTACKIEEMQYDICNIESGLELTATAPTDPCYTYEATGIGFSNKGPRVDQSMKTKASDNLHVEVFGTFN